ncbi:AMP-dependent synthetase [Rhizocola hellebori]|uniref:AMP-dependent synthetase n=1 Tax=Rhizocola hellebori TaxID=1392758 RepID=A0A8J3QEB7_9ACTN|nr:AMP-binding protein [Rhizocola hellebori]GIH08062.1 AMP-dependent synthetase [Rhizocola hellebori]
MIRSSWADVEIPESTVHEHVLAGAAARGDHPALIDGRNGQTMTYAEFAHGVDRLAAGLAAAGLRPGEVLALFSPNTLLYPVVFHAALKAGATVTTVNALSTGKDLSAQLRDSNARFLVTISAFLDRVEQASGQVEQIFLCDSFEGYQTVVGLMGNDHPTPSVAIDPKTTVAVLPYSSGTTGVAKGVMLTHRNLVANLAQFQPVIAYTPQDRVIAVLPFFHIYGLTAVMNAALAAGATIVVLPRFDLNEFLGALAQQRVTRVLVAPPIVLALAKHPAVAEHDLSSLQWVMSGAAPLDGDLAAACAERLGCAVQQGYGMTELSPVSHAQPFGTASAKPGSIGGLLPNTEARVVDVATGADLGPGQPGELLVRGPQVMLGYLGKSAETASTIDAEGWLHTGDLALVDAEGDFFIVDRVKELIKYKGYQVPPAELEAVLLAHPGIADAAVVAGHDATGEEIPHAFVALAPASTLSAEDIMSYVAERVAPYKKVRAVSFVDTIPKSASGKILRKDLRATL